MKRLQCADLCLLFIFLLTMPLKGKTTAMGRYNWMWMWMYGLQLGPNWIVPPFDELQCASIRPLVSPSRGYKGSCLVVIPEQDIPYMGGLWTRYLPKQVRLLEPSPIISW